MKNTRSNIISLSKDIDDINKTCYIYALLSLDEIVYIGLTNNPISRIKEHTKTDKIFNRYAIIKTINADINSKLSRKAERHYITKYRPKYNDRVKNGLFNSALSEDIVKRYKEDKIMLTSAVRKLYLYCDWDIQAISNRLEVPISKVKRRVGNIEY